MNEVDRHRSYLWLSIIAVVALIAAPIFLYMFLPRAGVPAALASGVIIVVALKHLGLLAVVLMPVYALLRRRARR